MGVREVSAILWRERQLLELLALVREQFRETELERAVEVSRVAADLGLPSDASLKQLAEAVPAPWQAMLLEHRRVFVSMGEELTGRRRAPAMMDFLR